MITIADTLTPDHIVLGLEAATVEEGVQKVAELLRDDEHVVDWEAFYEELKSRPPCRVADKANFGICIPHARTAAVSDMVMSVGRLARDLVLPDCAKPVRYLFCLGVPQTLASDYLRIAGALMRIFTDKETEEALRSAKTREAFLEALERLEMKL